MNWLCTKDFPSWDRIFEEIHNSIILDKLDISSKRKLFMCIEETAANIIMHSKSENSNTFNISISATPDYIKAVFGDEGKEFNPLLIQPPILIQSGKENRAGGMGIYMMKNMADELMYKYQNGVNLIIIKMYICHGE